MRSSRLASTLHQFYVFALTVGAAACSDSDGTAPEVVYSLAIYDGHERTVPAGTAVSPAPAVRVTNSRGTGVAGVRVNFVVASGGGSLSGASPTTGTDGTARVERWTLGQTAGANTLTATIDGASATVTLSATGVAGPAAALSKTSGDAQSGLAGVAVALAPAVRVTDQFGNPVAGTAVTFVVATGGGSILGAAQTSGPDGIARVGAWTLGTAGPQTLEATANGVTSGRVTFTATAAEVVIAPTRDTTLAGGTLTVTRLTIPAGVTVTAAGPLTVIAADTMTLAGTLRGNCVPLKVVTKSLLRVSGRVANGCAVHPPQVPALTLVGESGYELLRGGVIESSGAVLLTNDTTLTDEDFVPTGAEPLVAAGHGTKGPCKAEGVIRPPVEKAPNGAPGKHGKPGEPGAFKSATCRGDINANGAEIRGQDGGDGGDGTDENNAAGADAKGGDGGVGGPTLVRATGNIRFFEGKSFISGGHGGNGGNALATAAPYIKGDAAPGAKAIGGNGGTGGLPTVEARGSIILETVVEIRVGDGGDGGKAIARAADGRNAGEGRETPQGGGPAEARGGEGGEVPDKRLKARNVMLAVALVDAEGDGGRGGDAEAYGGKGGDGAMKPDNAKDGAAGGDVVSRGGAGGHSFVKMISGGLAGDGGSGGQARILGGNGGAGFTDCKLPPGFTTGGNGGKGGKLDGKGGGFGTGMTNGVRGSTLVENAGNGGPGGNGTTPGVGGEPGEDRLFKDGVFIDIQPVLTRGTKGKPCLESSVTAVSKNHFVGVTPCPQLLDVVTLRNNTDAPMTVTTVVVGSELLRVDGGPIVIPPGGTATFGITFTCARAASVDAQVRFIGTAAGENFVETVVDVRVATMTRAVKLAFALGTIPVGTEIPLSVIANGKVSGPEGGCPAPPSLLPPNTPDHLHSQTLAGITINTIGGSVGPYLDPNPTGCGYGRIILVILPRG